MQWRDPHSGVSLIELLVALALGAVILTSLSPLLSRVNETQTAVDVQIHLNERARFAMNRMIDSVADTSRLILPLADNGFTDQNESVRVQTFPSADANATAVLSVALPVYSDLNLDGIPDADNDGDGRIDEDWGTDNTNDDAAGVFGIDDDADGSSDEEGSGFLATGPADDDEGIGIANEDALDGIDNDGDGAIDEDVGADMNDDNQPGVAGVDDDGDGSIDEGDDHDDDEDGLVDEDWLDAVVFHLRGSSLIERRPVPFDTNGDAQLDGQDVVNSVIATGVTQLRIERVTAASNAILVDITLEMSSGDLDISLRTQIRVGGSL